MPSRKMAPYEDGIPAVSSAARRTALFGNPRVGQRLYMEDSGNTVRWDGAEWVVIYRYVDAALFNTIYVEDHGADGTGVADASAAFAAAEAARLAAGAYSPPTLATVSSCRPRPPARSSRAQRRASGTSPATR
jgi:hypothetical protein